nr:GIY-YIG nuclease family protein [Acidipropionibacterium jensenii]
MSPDPSSKPAGSDLSYTVDCDEPVDEFEDALDCVVAAGRTFKPVTSLSDWDGVGGCYIMVFDHYKQFYVGKSDNIRKRIKRHWTARKPFDRVLFRSPYNSILPVDELRPLDMTRLYATRSRRPFPLEERVERAADRRFCLNRLSGGELTLLKILNSYDRSLDVGVAPMSRTEHQRAQSEVHDVVTSAAMLPPANAAEALANMDMRIRAVTPSSGKLTFWSRRDEVGQAVIRGDLDTVRYAAFLEALGEHVVWPRADVPRNSVEVAVSS